MICYAEQYKLKPARGKSGQPVCVATLVGFFIGDNPMKVCKKCNVLHASKESYCKKCDAERSRKYHWANRERICRRKQLYYQKNREKCFEASRVYNKIYLDKILKRNREYCHQNPEKRKCYAKIHKAKQEGVLVAGNCEDCGTSPKQARIIAHHKDYNKPLVIIWLCTRCHFQRHRRLA